MLSYWHIHAADYARAALEHPDTEIVAVWDEDPMRGAAEAAALEVPFVADLGELLARDDVDAVVVDTPTSMHRDVIVAAARAGKHVFSEKVIAATATEADQVVAAVEAAGMAFVVSMWRSDEPSTAAIAELLATGALGRVTELRIRDGHPFALPSDEHPEGQLPAQFWHEPTAQGGILIDLCHPVYLAALFLGLPEDVSAAFGRATGRDLEDNAVVSLRYPDGAIAVVETSSVTAFTPFSIEAHGTKGSLLFSTDGIGEFVARRRAGVGAPGEPDPSGPSGTIHLRVANGYPAWRRIAIRAVERRSAFEKWIGHIQDGTRAHANVELARRLSAIVEAAYRSDAADGRRIRVSAERPSGADAKYPLPAGILSTNVKSPSSRTLA